MARIKCLSNYLSDIADALRDRYNIQTEIPAKDFDKMIYDLEYDESPDYVLFMDYDGTIIYRYTKAAFLALTAWPALPNHSDEGLIDGTWNWTDLDVTKQYVKDTGHLIIGPLYNTDDGAIHIYTNITNASYLSPTISLFVERTNLVQSEIDNPNYSALLTIDWGDGTVTGPIDYKQKDTPYSYTWDSVPSEYNHTYTSVGQYVVKVKYSLTAPSSTGGFRSDIILPMYFYGAGVNGSSADHAIYENYVTRVDFPLEPVGFNDSYYHTFRLTPWLDLDNHVTWDGRIFSTYPNMMYLNLGRMEYPNKSLAATNKAAFADCPKLKFIVTNLKGENSQQRFTNDSELIGVSLCQKFNDYSSYYFKGNVFVNCPKIDYICFPKTQYGSQYALCSNSGPFTHMWIPKTWTYLGMNDFKGCTLTSIYLPDNMTSLQNCFNRCEQLVDIKLPKYLQELQGSTFYECSALKKLRLPATLTAMSNSVLSYNDNFELLDCRACTQVPTILNGGQIYLNSDDAVIVVPDELYNDWIAASGWSGVTDKIVKESDWDAL